MDLSEFYASGRRTSPFGYSAGYVGFHYGQDFKGPHGLAIPTPWTITVVRSELHSGHGNVVVGQRSDGWYVSFSHLVVNPGWSYGAVIPEGAVVGYVGNTGQSYGAHLHIQISKSTMPWVHGSEVDPWPQIVAAINSSSGAGSGTTPFDPEEEDEMAKNTYIAWLDQGVQRNAILNTDSGFFSEFQSNDGGYNTEIARAFDVPPTVMVSLSHANVLKADCAAVRVGTK